MIQANELRLGNFVSYKGEQLTVTTIDQFGIEYEPDWGVEYKCEEIDPVPLTEEWLLNFGFEKEGNKFKDPRTNYYLERSVCWVFFQTPQYDESGYIKDIEYLHHLQNLYFALTGQELTLKQ